MTDSNAKRLDALYHLGATTIYASRVDSRFPYALYVPQRLASMDRDRMRILVSVHGTGRMQALYRDLFAEFAEYNHCIVLAPLFPANVLQDGNLSGYKYIEESGIRYDRIVLGMVEEVAERYDVPGERILMFGFSGGGHFVHRFTILHPDRILAASVGAPGAVTLLDFDRPWWVGVRDCEQRFGQRVDPAGFSGLPVHFVVGEADIETWEITFEPGDRYYMEGINDAGRTRAERLHSLMESFRRCGALTRLDVVPGASHDVVPLSRKSREFFLDVLGGDFRP